MILLERLWSNVVYSASRSSYTLHAVQASATWRPSMGGGRPPLYVQWPRAAAFHAVCQIDGLVGSCRFLSSPFVSL